MTRRATTRTWASIGPWLKYEPNGGHVQATVAFGVRAGDLKLALAYTTDYQNRAQHYTNDPITR